jgi:hypothetical protein
MEDPIKKKRGRKPKNFYQETAETETELLKKKSRKYIFLSKIIKCTKSILILSIVPVMNV